MGKDIGKSSIAQDVNGKIAGRRKKYASHQGHPRGDGGRQEGVPSSTLPCIPKQQDRIAPAADLGAGARREENRAGEKRDIRKAVKRPAEKGSPC